MPLSQDTLRFIREHRRDDVRSLALQARRYPSVDMPAAITHFRLADCQREDTRMGRERAYTLPRPPFSGTMLLPSNGTV